MNDVYDYETDIINPRKMEKGLEGGILAPEHHDFVTTAAKITTILIIAVTSLSFNIRHTIITLIFLLLVWEYSSPPMRLKEVPIIDSLSNGLIVFLAWLMGYTFSGGRFSGMPIIGITLGLCCTGIHSLAATLDYEFDNVAKMTTIATAIGQRPAAIFSFMSL